MKNKIYLVGLILILISFIACVLSYWLLIFGVPVFVVGSILIVLSKATIKRKLLATMLPIVLYFPATYLFLLAYNYTAPKTFIIPNNYDGTIRIVYEENCGIKYSEENGRQTLTFPDNGILVLNEHFDGGVKNEYYLVDKSGVKTEIKQYVGFEKESKTTPYILVGGSGTFGAGGQEKEITFSDFYLYNKDTLTSRENYRLLQKFDSLTWKVVNDCRVDK